MSASSECWSLHTVHAILSLAARLTIFECELMSDSEGQREYLRRMGFVMQVQVHPQRRPRTEVGEKEEAGRPRSGLG